MAGYLLTQMGNTALEPISTPSFRPYGVLISLIQLFAQSDSFPAWVGTTAQCVTNANRMQSRVQSAHVHLKPEIGQRGLKGGCVGAFLQIIGAKAVYQMWHRHRLLEVHAPIHMRDDGLCHIANNPAATSPLRPDGIKLLIKTGKASSGLSHSNFPCIFKAKAITPGIKNKKTGISFSSAPKMLPLRPSLMFLAVSTLCTIT